MDYIVYYRVSTKKQDLGIEAQKQVVSNFLTPEDTVLSTYEEKETGTNKKHRPVLEAALRACKESGATLLIAKLDRLARNVHFISGLMESGVQFKACDLPEADNTTIHIMAAMAQREADLIKKRTTDALGVIKKNIETQGFHVSKSGNTITALGGNRDFTDTDRRKAADAVRARAESNENNKRAAAFICVLHKQGANLSAIASALNHAGFKTARGNQFQAVQVKRLLERHPCE